MKKISIEGIEQRKRHLYEKFNKEDAEILIKLGLEISPEEFEYFVAYSLGKIGGMKMFVIGGFNDGGIDIKGKRTILGKDEYFAIQCKRWNTWQVGEGELKKFIGSTIKAKYEHGARLFFVCTNELTYNAKKYSDEVGIEYVDENIILDMYKMIDWNDFLVYLNDKMGAREEIKDEKFKHKIQSKVSTKKDLFSLLKEVRLKLAKDSNLPPYCVFKDETLKIFSERKPITKMQFLNISGVGETKFQKYGEQFMETIKNYSE